MLRLLINIILVPVVLFLLYVATQIVLQKARTDARPELPTSIHKVDEVKIAILWPFSHSGSPAGIRQGAELAIATINEQGGIHGKPLRAVYYDNRGDKKLNARLSRQISADPSYRALIGSYFSSLAYDTLVATQKTNLLYVIVAANVKKLTSLDFKHVIRPNFNAEIYNVALSRHLINENYHTIVVVEDQTDFSFESASIISKELKDRTQRKVHDIIVPTWSKNFRSIISSSGMENVDAIYLTIGFEQAQLFISQMKEFGLGVQIYADANFFTYRDIQTLGDAAEGLRMIAPFKELALWHGNPNLTEMSDTKRNFYQNFTNRYDTFPDYWSREIYDAILLFAQAVNRSESLDSLTLASYIRFHKNWDLAKGIVNFDEFGDLENKDFFLMEVKDGVFTLPYGEKPISSSKDVDDVFSRELESL